MSVGNALPCCCDDSPQTWPSCTFTYPSEPPECDDLYQMSDFEATVDFQMRYIEGDEDIVTRWQPYFLPGCSGTTACDQDTSIVRSFTPAQIAIRNATIKASTNCKVATNSTTYSDPAQPFTPVGGPLEGTRLEYEGIDWNGASGETNGVIEFDTSYSYGAYPRFPRFSIGTRCNVSALVGQNCANWSIPHPTVTGGRFEVLEIQMQAGGFVQWCSGSTPTQRSGWLSASNSSIIELDNFGYRDCSYQAIFLYWREYPSDPTAPEYVFTPGTFEFYGARVGVFDYIIAPPFGSSGGCPGTGACSLQFSPTCCCCASNAIGSLATQRRYYGRGGSGNCGTGNFLRAGIGMFPWNAATGQEPPPGMEFDVPSSLEIG